MLTDLFGILNTPAFWLAGKPVPWSDLIGNIFALLTVGLALKRSVWSWPVQILGSILLLSASLSAHLGGNASRQVVIIAAAVWGWSAWQKSKSETGSIEVRWATWKERAVLLAALIVGTAVFGTVLKLGDWSWNPYPDAYIFIGSLVAMYAQGKAIVEFWFVWLAACCSPESSTSSSSSWFSWACATGPRDRARRFPHRPQPPPRSTVRKQPEQPAPRA